MYKATRYHPSSPTARANGQVLMPYFEVLQGSELAHLIKTYDLDKLDPNTFYPQQTVCDMQKAMSEKMGLFSGELTAIGIKSIDSIGFPEEVQTIKDALAMLQQIYHMIHQNIPAEEGWLFEEVSEDTLKISFNSPYEPFAAYGYIYAIARQFRPEDKSFSVYMDDEEGIAVYTVKFS